MFTYIVLPKKNLILLYSLKTQGHQLMPVVFLQWIEAIF